MKHAKILTIIALSVLGLSLILYIVTRLVKSSSMKVKLTHTSSFLIIIAVVLLAISQFISETQEPMEEEPHDPPPGGGGYCCNAIDNAIDKPYQIQCNKKYHQTKCEKDKHCKWNAEKNWWACWQTPAPA